MYRKVSFLSVVSASFWKELKLFSRYPSWLLVSLISPFLWITLFILFGQAFSVGTDFVGFITIGMLGLDMASQTLWGFGLGLRREQMRGTLLSLYASPSSRIAILLGMALEGILEIIIDAVIIFSYAFLFFNFNIFIADPLAVILVLSLTFFSLLGFGLIFAAVTMIVKEPNALINVIQPILYIFAGVFFPTKVLPPAGQLISKAIPLTYALDAMRKAMIQGYTTLQLIQDMAILGAFGLILTFIGVFVLNLLEKRAMVTGSLAKF
ncbi:MAG: ABC transporter permease [Candidatus Njordarchaeia archaeon]